MSLLLFFNGSGAVAIDYLSREQYIRIPETVLAVAGTLVPLAAASTVGTSLVASPSGAITLAGSITATPASSTVTSNLVAPPSTPTSVSGGLV